MLIEEARRLGGYKTKSETVTAALEEYGKRQKQQRILADFGIDDFDPESTSTKPSASESAPDDSRRYARLTPFYGAEQLIDRPMRGNWQAALSELIQQGRMPLMGGIRQVVLSGIRVQSEFRRIRDPRRGFSEVKVDVAELRRRGVCERSPLVADRRFSRWMAISLTMEAC